MAQSHPHEFVQVCVWKDVEGESYTPNLVTEGHLEYKEMGQQL